MGFTTILCQNLSITNKSVPLPEKIAVVRRFIAYNSNLHLNDTKFYHYLTCFGPLYFSSQYLQR